MSDPPPSASSTAPLQSLSRPSQSSEPLGAGSASHATDAPSAPQTMTPSTRQTPTPAWHASPRPSNPSSTSPSQSLSCASQISVGATQSPHAPASQVAMPLQLPITSHSRVSPLMQASGSASGSAAASGAGSGSASTWPSDSPTPVSRHRPRSRHPTRCPRRRMSQNSRRRRMQNKSIATRSPSIDGASSSTESQ